MLNKLLINFAQISQIFLLHYYIGIIKKLSPRKVFNFVKLFIGFHYSRLTKQATQLGLPFFVSIEPTTSCNLRCPQCPSGLREFTRPTGMLQHQLFEKIILQLKPTLHSLTFYFQGEPYLNPDFLNMVNFAGKQNIFTITSTNAHYLTEENAKKTIESKLDKLIISVDGITQEVYEQYRIGGKLDKVLSGTQEILKQKKLLKSKTPHVVWQFVVFKPNQHQIEAVKKLGKELGVDEVKIKTAQVYDFENGHSLIPDLEKYSRYKKNGNNFEIKNKLLNQCWRMWQGCVITWDGKIVPCCFDKDAKYQLGNLENETFKNVWHSQAYNQFRNAVLQSRNKIDICTNCTEGTKVWA
ncbi:MAG: SPASM domain-containing protein [Bacteroidetes bacterium]|nr:SPASM domain-containing protein [Bacteroidota bacterium]